MATRWEIDEYQKEVSEKMREEFGSENVVTAYKPENFDAVELWENDERNCSRWLKADQSGEECYYEMLEQGKIDEATRWYEVGVECADDVEMTGVYVRGEDILLDEAYEFISSGVNASRFTELEG